MNGLFTEVFEMAKKSTKKVVNQKCPISGYACINCSLYRGKHFNLCFQDHFGGDEKKLTGPLKSMGYPASAQIVKCENCSSGYLVINP
jgi:hypothetical protein